MSPKLIYIIRFTIAILFILFGVYVLFVRDKINLDSPYNYLFSLLLMVYGSYRFYRAKKSYDEQEI